MLKKYLEVGQIAGTRGISGELKVKTFCDSPAVFCEIENLYFSPNFSLKIDITQKKVFKDLVLIRINDIQTIEEASKFIGKSIYARRDDIPRDEERYFIDDIIGLDIIDIDTNEIYGKVCNVIQTGANDVYCIKNSESKEFLIPAIKDVIKNIDLEKNIISISPIRGMFDD